jgi:metal-responsive CopG/Arc/MetJ family transcriptional regulator
MGMKTMLVKGRWSLCAHLPTNTAPQRGSGTFRRVHLNRALVTSWVVSTLSILPLYPINKDFSGVHPSGGSGDFQTRRPIMSEEIKTRIPLWLYPSTIEGVDAILEKDNCKSRSEFIEKAIRFYSGYIAAEDGMKYLPTAITSAMSGIVSSSENRMARLTFKLAVEMSMMMNILATTADVDENTLRRLRGKCVNDVKKSVGSVTFEDVVKFQKGD